MIATALFPLLAMGDRDAKFEITPTNITNIFIPIGSVVPKTDWTTIQFNLIITSLFDEANKLCTVVKNISKIHQEKS